MAKLIYSAITSLDGYVEDEDGNFDWAAPDEEVHSFVNDLERPVGTYLHGRRMYETIPLRVNAGVCSNQRGTRPAAGSAHGALRGPARVCRRPPVLVVAVTDCGRCPLDQPGFARIGRSTTCTRTPTTR